MEVFYWLPNGGVRFVAPPISTAIVVAPPVATTKGGGVNAREVSEGFGGKERRRAVVCTRRGGLMGKHNVYVYVYVLVHERVAHLSSQQRCRKLRAIFIEKIVQ